MTRTLLQQALGALHPQANRAFVEATKDALRSALAAPQPEPVAYVPRCHTDGNYCIVGEYKWDEIEEKPFGLADPAHWECAALYAAPPAAPAPADRTTSMDYGMFVDEATNPPAPAVPTISPLALRALRMADMALASWENGYAFDSHGPGREAQRLVTDALALSAAPAVREPQDERAAFEAWAKSIGLDLYSVIGSQDSANPFGGYTRYAYEAWMARAHGIGGGGK